MKKQTNSKTNRRQFLRTASTVTAIPVFAWTQPAFANNSANDRPTIGAIGLGGQGLNVSKGHSNFGDILAVCDVDSRHAERARVHEKVGKLNPDMYGDYRKVLERDDIDVVSIMTVDHWHVKIAIEALEAGKHVFCEKPLTLTLEENQLIRKACEKHKDKTFAVGTWQRSQKDTFVRAVNMVQKGLLGDIKKVTIGINAGAKGGPFPVAAVPKELDWDMWQGQVPNVEYREKRCHYTFRWWYEYSGGKFTDWGAHHVDIALWALEQDKFGTGPVEFDGSDAKHPVEFKQGMPLVDDRFNTSHDFDVKCRFANGIKMSIGSRVDNGILFEGSKGRIFVTRKKITGQPIEENWDEGKFTDEDVHRLHNGKPNEWASANFFRCIREGGLTMSDPFSHIQTMNTCHLSAIAARLQQTFKWNPETEEIVDNPVAASFFARERRQSFDILKV